MKVECAHDKLVPVGDLKPHPKNPNTHSAAQIAALAHVIESSGWRTPITVSSRSGFIVRGHGRLEAALLLGCDTVPVDFQDYPSDEAELADLLADNHLSELCEIDEQQLVTVLRELDQAGFDLAGAGYTPEEFARLTEQEDPAESLKPIPAMELQAFEHYDYLIFMFRDLRDWNQRPDPRMLQRNDPISVVHWVGGVVGVVGKTIRWDEMLQFKCDIDCGLSELLHNRILWHESRFCFEQKRDKNLGGNSRFRSPERIEAEKRYLQKKWQAHILIDQYQSQDRVKVKVERKQSVDL